MNVREFTIKMVEKARTLLLEGNGSLQNALSAALLVAENQGDTDIVTWIEHKIDDQFPQETLSDYRTLKIRLERFNILSGSEIWM